jgi:hypothetical protein
METVIVVPVVVLLLAWLGHSVPSRGSGRRGCRGDSTTKSHCGRPSVWAAKRSATGRVEIEEWRKNRLVVWAPQLRGDVLERRLHQLTRVSTRFPY